MSKPDPIQAFQRVLEDARAHTREIRQRVERMNEAVRRKALRELPTEGKVH
jgi:hypothetical protein